MSHYSPENSARPEQISVDSHAAIVSDGFSQGTAVVSADFPLNSSFPGKSTEAQTKLNNKARPGFPAGLSRLMKMQKFPPASRSLDASL